MNYKKKSSCGTARWNLAVFCILLLFVGWFAQSYSETTDAILGIGHYWTVVTHLGQRAKISRGLLPQDYEIWGMGQRGSTSMEGGQVMTLYASNWYDDVYDPAKPVVRPYVACKTMELKYNSSGTLISPLTSYSKYSLTDHIVDGQTIEGDAFATEDPTKLIGTADQIVQVTHQYAIGVNTQKTFLGWSHDPHSFYNIYEVVLENVSSDTLTDFHASFVKTSSGMFKSYGDQDQRDFGSQDERKAWYHYYGGRQESEGDSLRIYYWYWPDESQTPDDEMGGPVDDEFFRGYFDRADIQFSAILHASTAPYTDTANDVDNPKQPLTTFAGGAWSEGTPIRAATHLGLTDAEWNTHLGAFAESTPMTNQDPGSKHQQNPDELGEKEWDAIAGGFDNMWPRATMVFPYSDFPPGHKIRIVFANGYAGFDIEKCLELGHKWYASTLEAPPNLPNTTKGYFPDNFVLLSSSTRDINKDLWISTLIDSVHKTVTRAGWNFAHNYNIPSAPPPPSNQEVTGEIGGIEIKWSNEEAEALSNFAGHRIMRFLATEDTVITNEIYRTTETGATHTFVDSSVIDGANYFYYVQSGVTVDGDPNATNAMPEMKGGIIWSNRLAIPSKKHTNSDTRSTPGLADVRVVPNPYNVTDPNLASYGFKGGNQPRGIFFYNLPGPTIIRIYTEDGNLVKTLHHKELTGRNEMEWDLITDSQQLAQSGLYLAVFEDQDGNVDFEKFIIVR